MATAGAAFAVPWVILSPNPVFLGVISYRTATSAILCAFVAILSWAVLNRRSGQPAGGEKPPLRLSRPVATGKYGHSCGALFDEPAVYEDFVGKKKYYACPGCHVTLGEITAPEPPKPEPLKAEAPKEPEPPKPQEQPVLLEIVIKGPASARVATEAPAP